MNKQSTIGKLHVINVGAALNQFLKGNSITGFTEPVQETAKYIIDLYPNIQEVITKYDTTNPYLQPDLRLKLHETKEVKISLFYIKGSSKIQPKNIGAKSFLEKYFHSEILQNKFNAFLSSEYDKYLNNIVKTKEHIKSSKQTTTELRKKVKQYYPKFVCEIDPYRKSLLYTLREYCFQLLKDEFNEDKLGILNAFKEFLMMDTINIITRHDGGNKCLLVEEWNFSTNSIKDIHIYKKGNTTVGIRMGREAITIRFKLESGPASSIKLATSYDYLPTEHTLVKSNLKSIETFEQSIAKHKQIETGDTSNAIGKCNEAMTYYRILKTNPSISQVDAEEYQQMLTKYSPVVPHKTLLNLYNSSESANEAIQQYLQEKYQNYVIESIQLIPDIYIKNRLDTRDLLIVLQVDKQYIEEGFSLKGIAKNNVKITVKNPGAGQILGPQYFNSGSLKQVIATTKEAFQENQLDHQEAIEIVSEAIGQNLQTTSQEKLIKGITSIIGYAPTLVTVYTTNKSKIIKHGAVTGVINVYPKKPSPKQTTLSWNENEEELSLRVKFSGSQSKGWSSLKLACEYSVGI